MENRDNICKRKTANGYEPTTRPMESCNHSQFGTLSSLSLSLSLPTCFNLISCNFTEVQNKRTQVFLRKFVYAFPFCHCCVYTLQLCVNTVVLNSKLKNHSMNHRYSDWFHSHFFFVLRNDVMNVFYVRRLKHNFYINYTNYKSKVPFCL